MGDTKIPCVYVGVMPLRLSADHGPFFDGDGKPLKTMDILPGDTLMMPEKEVNGMTIWHDPRSILPSEMLGTGRVVKAEHEGLDMDTLLALGYEFSDGREDFLTIEQAKQKAADEAKKTAQSTEEQSQQKTPQDVAPKVATAAPTPAPITSIPVPPPAPTIPVSVTPSQGNNGTTSDKSEVKE